jgi:hypothetical protein
MQISQQSTHTLALRVQVLAQLFNSLDPTPFLNKDLDGACETFIENWALSLPQASHLALTIHIEQSSVPTEAAELITAAVHNHYAYKAGLVRGQLSQLLRLGRMSLLIGLGFVASCLLLAEAISAVVGGPVARVVKESLTIIGWVALWRPVQIFLYDWWPLKGRITVFENLQFARVSVT